MAVTTVYTLVDPATLDLPNATTINLDMTAGQDGGLIISGIDRIEADRPLRYETVNSVGGVIADHAALQPIEAASITTLSNGNVVIAGLADHDGVPGGDVGFTVLNKNSLTPLKDWTYPVTDNADNVEVQALAGGGFVIAFDTLITETDHDISMWLYDSAGEVLATPYINCEGLAVAPTIAALDDGKFSIAWQETTDTGFAVMNALLNVGGLTYAQAAHAVDVNDDPANVQSIATAEGYALVFEDGLDLRMTTFDFDGVQIDTAILTDNLDNDCGDVSLVRLDNGLIAYSYAYDFGPDHDLYMQIVDPTTLTKLFATEQIIAQDLTDETDSVLQAYGDGRFAFGWNNDDASGEAVSFGLSRATQGDNAANTLTGDDAIDVMAGGRGKDALFGFDNNDTLRGDGDKDTLYGGRGNDTLDGGGNGDSLYGQKGFDVFVYDELADSQKKRPDKIFLLESIDVIDLQAIDANSAEDGDQAFTLVDKFTRTAGEATVTFHTKGAYIGTTTVDVDVDGDRKADFRIVLDGDHADFTDFAF